MDAHTAPTAGEILSAYPGIALFFSEDHLQELSPAASRLLPESAPGDTPEAVFGPETNDMLGNLMGDGRFLPIKLANARYDMTVTALSGGLLYTLRPSQDDVFLGQLSKLGRSLGQSTTEVLAASDRILNLLENQDSPQMLARYGAMQHGLYQLLRLSRNLNTISDTPPAILHRMDLAEWFHSQAEKLRPLLESLHRSLESQVTPEFYYCDADADGLERALLNLISNAVKFSPENSVITMSLRRIGDRLRLTVQDTGCGIPADQLGALFTLPAQQSVVPDARQGSGLGLPTARRLLEAQGGMLMLDSTVGEGTRVHMILPASPNRSLLLRSPVQTPRPRRSFDAAVVELSDLLPVEAFLGEI